jgi:hypothetical protein
MTKIINTGFYKKNTVKSLSAKKPYIAQVTAEDMERNRKLSQAESKQWVRNSLLKLPGLALSPFRKAKDLIEDIKSGKYGNPSDYV